MADTFLGQSCQPRPRRTGSLPSTGSEGCAPSMACPKPVREHRTSSRPGTPRSLRLRGLWICTPYRMGKRWVHIVPPPVATLGARKRLLAGDNLAAGATKAPGYTHPGVGLSPSEPYSLFHGHFFDKSDLMQVLSTSLQKLATPAANPYSLFASKPHDSRLVASI